MRDCFGAQLGLRCCSLWDPDLNNRHWLFGNGSRASATEKLWRDRRHACSVEGISPDKRNFQLRLATACFSLLILVISRKEVEGMWKALLSRPGDEMSVRRLAGKEDDGWEAGEVDASKASALS